MHLASVVSSHEIPGSEFAEPITLNQVSQSKGMIMVFGPQFFFSVSGAKNSCATFMCSARCHL